MNIIIICNKDNLTSGIIGEIAVKIKKVRHYLHKKAKGGLNKYI